MVRLIDLEPLPSSSGKVSSSGVGVEVFAPGRVTLAGLSNAEHYRVRLVGSESVYCDLVKV